MEDINTIIARAICCGEKCCNPERCIGLQVDVSDIAKCLSDAGYVIVPRDYPDDLLERNLAALSTVGVSGTWQVLISAWEGEGGV